MPARRARPRRWGSKNCPEKTSAAANKPFLVHCLGRMTLSAARTSGSRGTPSAGAGGGTNSKRREERRRGQQALLGPLLGAHALERGQAERVSGDADRGGRGGYQFRPVHGSRLNDRPSRASSQAFRSYAAP